ncbi:dihydrofolate reductase [soil metagenome]
MKISLIAAVAANGVIGRNNALPWNLPDDSTFYKDKITNHVVIMGRKSLEAAPEPLPSLASIVITQNKDFKALNIITARTFNNAVNEAVKIEKDEIFVIGGAQIYSMAMPFATTLYLTEIKKVYEGDTFFPAFNKSEWKEITRVSHLQDKRHETAFDFVTYERS